MLRDPYYTELVRYKGQLYPGRHPAIISDKLFNQVQEQLDTRGTTSTRYRVYDHPLKGVSYCGVCHLRGAKRRMTLQKADGNGGRCWYFFCSGHVDKTCDSQFINVVRAEDAIALHYKTVALAPAFIAAMRDSLAQYMAEADQVEKETRQQLETKMNDLELRESKLIELAADDQLPRQVIHAKLAALNIDREKARRELANLNQDLAASAETLETALKLLEDPGPALPKASWRSQGREAASHGLVWLHLHPARQ